jgi:hypothetical protein
VGLAAAVTRPSPREPPNEQEIPVTSLPRQRRSGKIILRHATPVRNLRSVLRLGLLCSYSRGKLPVVWLHCPAKTYWAMVHTVERHHGRIEQVVIIEVKVPRKWLRRSRRGLWYCTRDIPPQCFGRAWRFAELSASPVSE